MNIAIAIYGYDPPATPLGYVESAVLDNPATGLLYRTYGGPPFIDHFYTTDFSEFASVVNNYGYADEGNVGALRLVQEVGTIPVYRVSRWWAETGDLMHRYFTDPGTVDFFVNGLGWAFEGVEGYIWPMPVPNTTAHPSITVPSVEFRYNATDQHIYLVSRGVNGVGDPQIMTVCPGHATVYMDGNYLGTTGFALSYLPGPSTTMYCLVDMGPAFGTHRYRAEFNGYTARIHEPGSDNWVSWPPYIADVTVTH